MGEIFFFFGDVPLGDGDGFGESDVRHYATSRYIITMKSLPMWMPCSGTHPSGSETGVSGGVALMSMWCAIISYCALGGVMRSSGKRVVLVYVYDLERDGERAPTHGC